MAKTAAHVLMTAAVPLQDADSPVGRRTATAAAWKAGARLLAVKVMVVPGEWAKLLAGAAGRRAPRAGKCGSPGATPSTRCARSRPRARLCPRCSHRREGGRHDSCPDGRPLNKRAPPTPMKRHRSAGRNCQYTEAVTRNRKI